MVPKISYNSNLTLNNLKQGVTLSTMLGTVLHCCIISTIMCQHHHKIMPYSRTEIWSKDIYIFFMLLCSLIFPNAKFGDIVILLLYKKCSASFISELVSFSREPWHFFMYLKNNYHHTGKTLVKVLYTGGKSLKDRWPAAQNICTFRHSSKFLSKNQLQPRTWQRLTRDYQCLTELNE